MSKILSMDELRKMQEADLRKEIKEQYSTVAQLRYSVKSGKEKGSHLYKQEQTQLARMLTVLSELQQKASTTSISVPS